MVGKRSTVWSLKVCQLSVTWNRKTARHLFLWEQWRIRGVHDNFIRFSLSRSTFFPSTTGQCWKVRFSNILLYQIDCCANFELLNILGRFVPIQCTRPTRELPEAFLRLLVTELPEASLAPLRGGRVGDWMMKPWHLSGKPSPFDGNKLENWHL